MLSDSPLLTAEYVCILAELSSMGYTHKTWSHMISANTLGQNESFKFGKNLLNCGSSYPDVDTEGIIYGPLI